MTGNAIREALEPFLPHADVFGWRPDDFVVYGSGGMNITAGDLRRARSAYDALSTHTAAGAGLAGEAVTWRDMTSAPKDATEIILRIPSQGWPDHYAQIGHWAEDMSGEEQPPYRGWFCKTGYGCAELNEPTGWKPMPVEEPSDIERLRRERDEATQMVWRREVERDKELARANTAEAALAETRGLIRDAIGLVPLAHQNWHTDARTALGDAQEAGR